MRNTTAKLAELGLVALGGAVGTLARYLLNELIGEVDWLPLGVLIINLSGAFLLGALLEAVALRGPDTGARRKARLLLGTGVLGGYTTYSLLAADIAAMFDHGQMLAGTAYGLATLVFGGLASWFGILVAKSLRGRGRIDSNPSTGASS
ncbi:fluoride efflux transporter FluC [Leucobacter viscericola]|uniref:fluoride efflux transporter FluC n=1 Tax=Leucobacter viscericola TaxID=2714935 RepID=UPI001FCB9CFD|nr:CrcB family protein [Leucobacter viscericola]